MPRAAANGVMLNYHLAIVGEQDEGTPVAAAQYIQGRIPSSILKVIPEAAHLSNVEQSPRFNATVLEFPDKLDKS